MTGYSENLPCLLGGDCPAICLPSPLGDMEMWYGVKPGSPLWKMWEMDHLSVFSMGLEEKGGRVASCGETKGESERSSETVLESVALSSESVPPLPNGLLLGWTASGLQSVHLHI